MRESGIPSCSQRMTNQFLSPCIIFVCFEHAQFLPASPRSLSLQSFVVSFPVLRPIVVSLLSLTCHYRCPSSWPAPPQDPAQPPRFPGRGCRAYGKGKGKRGLAQEGSLSDCGLLQQGLLGPGLGHPGDRACLGRAGAERGPLAVLFTVAQTPSLALSARACLQPGK